MKGQEHSSQTFSFLPRGWWFFEPLDITERSVLIKSIILFSPHKALNSLHWPFYASSRTSTPWSDCRISYDLTVVFLIRVTENHRPRVMHSYDTESGRTSLDCMNYGLLWTSYSHASYPLILCSASMDNPALGVFQLWNHTLPRYGVLQSCSLLYGPIKCLCSQHHLAYFSTITCILPSGSTPIGQA